LGRVCAVHQFAQDALVAAMDAIEDADGQPGVL
jgi:hypothetical protein